MKRVSLVSVLALALLLCLAAAASAAGTPGAHHAAVKVAAAGKVVHNGAAKVGDKTVCPVMGKPFTVTAESPSSVYEGKTIYFCCVDCKKKFDADPAKYMKKAEVKKGAMK